MYRIEPAGPCPHLVSDTTLTPEEFRRIAREIGASPVRARKVGRIAARRAIEPEHVETLWNGKESEADAAPGDWIVTALAASGEPLRDRDGHMNRYVIKSDRFAELYEPIGELGPNGALFRPKGVVEAVHIPGGFEIKAPWGEMQRAVDGWLLLNGHEVYGNHRDTFAATYEITA
jgi:hypothetical protein